MFHKTGRRIDGAGSFRDAVRSTRNRVVYTLGLNVVVLSVRVTPVWGGMPIGLPVAARIRRKDSDATTADLARDMLAQLAGWLPDRTFEVACDGAYATLCGAGLARVHITSRLRRDAAVYELTPLSVAVAVIGDLAVVLRRLGRATILAGHPLVSTQDPSVVRRRARRAATRPVVTTNYSLVARRTTPTQNPRRSRPRARHRRLTTTPSPHIHGHTAFHDGPPTTRRQPRHTHQTAKLHLVEMRESGIPVRKEPED